MKPGTKLANGTAVALGFTMIAIGAGAAETTAPATSMSAPLIERSVLFGNPERAQARLSPDGKYLSYLAPRDGVLNVFVGPANDFAAAKPITNDKMRGIRQHFWAYDSKHVLFLQDEGGDENFHLWAVGIDTGREVDLTPIRGVLAYVVGLSWKKPGTVLVALNDRTPEWHDLWEIDIESGARRLVERNTNEFGSFVADLDLRPRLAVKQTADGGEVFRRDAKGWQSVVKYGQADSLTTQPLGIEGNGRGALMLSSVDRDKAALVRLDLATGKTVVIGESKQADVSAVWTDPRTNAPQAFAAEYLMTEVTPLTAAATRDVQILTNTIGAQFDVVSRTLDDKTWIVVADDPLAPASVHRYDRAAGAVTKLFDQRPALNGAPLRPMQAIEIQSRDGLTLPTYLTLPVGSDPDGTGRPKAPVPLVLNVHGGPWARDEFGFDPEHQWLANRGYAVLSVNYRGSTGFGKSFVNAGDREWAAKMHDDLLDAIDWAVREKITTADKVAIYGGSYGGYATLVALTFTPERFACGVDIVGPSNLFTLLGSIPPYWKSFYEDLARRVGDPRTEEGKKLLAERSPLNRVQNISKPLLIGQGANDPRVKQAESDQIVAAMKAKGLPVTYVLYPDEGHGFARPPNRTSFYAVTEGFLAQCLGGRQQPIGGDFAGATLQVLEGAQHVPGLAEALKAK